MTEVFWKETRRAVQILFKFIAVVSIFTYFFNFSKQNPFCRYGKGMLWISLTRKYMLTITVSRASRLKSELFLVAEQELLAWL